jgi:hypothetical protein
MNCRRGKCVRTVANAHAAMTTKQLAIVGEYDLRETALLGSGQCNECLSLAETWRRSAPEVLRGRSHGTMRSCPREIPSGGHASG